MSRKHPSILNYHKSPPRHHKKSRQKTKYHYQFHLLASTAAKVWIKTLDNLAANSHLNSVRTSLQIDDKTKQTKSYYFTYIHHKNCQIILIRENLQMKSFCELSNYWLITQVIYICNFRHLLLVVWSYFASISICVD